MKKLRSKYLLFIWLLLFFSTTNGAFLHRRVSPFVPDLIYSPILPRVPMTWDPINKSATISLSSANMVATQTAGAWNTVKTLSSFGKTSGLYYARVVITGVTSGNVMVGVGNVNASLITYCGGDFNGWGYFGATGQSFTGGSPFPFGATYTTGDTVDIAINVTLGRVWYGKNDVWQNSGNPAANTGTAFTGVNGLVFILFSANSAGSARLLANAADCKRLPPAGFSYWDPS